MSSNPTRVTIETPLMRKAAGNTSSNLFPSEKLRALSLVSATLEIEYATQLVIWVT